MWREIMFVIYSKQTGNIITATGSDLYRTIEDMYPMSYVDFEIIYDCMNVPLNEAVLQDITAYKVDLETKDIVPIVAKKYSLEELVALGVISDNDLQKLK